MKDDSRPLIEQSGLSDARRNRDRKRRRDRKQASFQGYGIERGWTVLNPWEGSVNAEKSSNPQGDQCGKWEERNGLLAEGCWLSPLTSPVPVPRRVSGRFIVLIPCETEV